jgi:type I site-specific restriction endonuclease
MTTAGQSGGANRRNQSAEVVLAEMRGEMNTAFAELKGQIKEVGQKLDGAIVQLTSAIDFGDRQNSQLIGNVRDEVARAHSRLDEMGGTVKTLERSVDDRFTEQAAQVSNNRRFIIGGLLFPFLVGACVALLVFVLRVRG